MTKTDLDHVPDHDPERAAILAVIERETRAYLDRDFAAWETCWHDGPEIRRIHTHAGTGVTRVEGPQIREQMRRLLSKNTDWVPSEAIRRENFNVVIGADMAWVTYDQFGDMSGVLGELAGQYHELKILQKVGGAWKIACIVGTQVRIDHVRAPLIEIAPDLRILWQNDAACDRLPEHPKLAQRGDFLRPQDPGARRDLAEAVAWIAEVRDRHTPCVGDDAVSRAVALGQDDAGLAHICWALLQDGKLLITFDDSDRLTEQISRAAGVYGLSDAQEQLARHVVEGRDLAAAAQAMQVSPNTAKTHLQRIYDKVGVRAQPALVRQLLNADLRGV